MTQPSHPQPDPTYGWTPPSGPPDAAAAPGWSPAPGQPAAGWPSAQQPGQGWSGPPQQQPGQGWPPPQQPGQGWTGQPQPQQPGQGWTGQPQPQPPQPGAAWPVPPVQQPGAAWPVPPQPGSAWPGAPQQAYPTGPGHPGGPGPAPLPPPWQPPATLTAKRIPEDLPFVARPNLGKRALVFGALLLFIGLVLACPLGLAASSDGDAALLLVIPVIMLFVALPLGLQFWLISSGGPALAVGPDGLWIKTRPTRGQAIWLPWAAIDRIYLRRWSLEKMVCVKPRDPRTGSGLGAFTALDSGLQQAFFGTGFTATANFADRSEEEIMRAIVGYAAGRCRVG